MAPVVGGDYMAPVVGGDYMAPMVGGQISREQWGKDIDRGTPKYVMKNLFQCHIAYEVWSCTVISGNLL